MRTPNDIAADDIAAWNAVSDAERTRPLNVWSVDARCRDPLMRADGRAAIAAMIAGAVAQVPGQRFALRGTPDGHGSFARFSWTRASEGGQPVAAGTDVVRLDDRGSVAEVIGVLDEVQP